MAKVITIAQQKGGAGKTSIAAHLAGYWASKGKSVALLDADPQASLSTWIMLREEIYGPDDRLILKPSSGWRATSDIRRVGGKADIVIIDTPPHAEASGRVAIRAANIVIVPCQLSPMDLWASEPTLEMIAKQKSKALMVLNRVPPRSRMADALSEQMVMQKFPLAKAMLGQRNAFASSLMQGLSVTEAEPRSRAATEIRALAAEIIRKAR